MKRLLPAFFLLLVSFANAQTRLDTVSNKVNNISKALQILREFRIMGYVQVQYQRADTAGAKSFAGGDFPTLANNRLMVRRGRLKINFDHDGNKGFRIFQTSFQMDLTERGLKLRDFYGRIIDPWTGWVGLQGGVMDRPFGYEVRTGDDTRESPERTRLSQTVFPDEKDMGVELVVESPKTFKPVYLRMDAGIFNGIGGSATPAGVAASPFANKKDFIGSIKAAKTFKLDSAGKVFFTLSGGASYYRGGVLESKNVFDIEKTGGSDTMGYAKIYDSIGNAFQRYVTRQYYGVDIQASLDYKIGTSTLRGEFIAGQQPGTATSYAVPTALTVGDLYLRKFNGLYLYYIQTFKQKAKDHTILHELVFKYDWFNPNTQVSQNHLNNINMATGESGADIKYQTFGIGYNFRPYDFFKLMVYYDIVNNPTDAVKGFTRDLKDNVLTIRAQFLFDSDWFNKKVKAL